MRRDQVSWDEVQEGDELPEISLSINIKRLFQQASGSQDWYPVHFDPAYAQKAGHSDVFMNTGFIQAALVRLITDWMGEAGFLKRLFFEMRRQYRPGDTMICRGRVTEKEQRNGEALVFLEVWGENEREGVATPGEATVVLPVAQNLR
ncbi:MAG: MaoC family dehydratase N-terminal domain-containing protein [Dehalococcoidia bacterium]